MTWDGLQCAVLDALGHTRYRVQSTQDAAPLPEDPLLDALLHAAGRNRDAEDAAAVFRSLGALSALRSGPAKRALWPILRRLRAASH